VKNVVDIPYDMISSVRIDKGIFSSNIIFRAPGLISSGRRGKLDKIMEGYENTSGLGEGQDGIITAITKNKAEDLLEVIRNGMDRNREVYGHPQAASSQQSSISIADELTKLSNLKEKGIISEIFMTYLNTSFHFVSITALHTNLSCRQYSSDIAAADRVFRAFKDARSGTKLTTRFY
jgi:hypothetical protein